MKFEPDADAVMKAIAPCEESDLPAIFEIINQSAVAYKGVIPADRWHEPYMPFTELQAEIARGVRFFGCQLDHRLVGVMGIQDVKDVTLIRHAYVRTEHRGQGIGRALLEFLGGLTARPVMIGTWKAASWAVRFYEQNGFRLVSEEEKNRLLKTYWTVPEQQIEESVVMIETKAKTATMSTKTIQPYLLFGGRCEEALEFYRTAIGAQIDLMMRFKESPDPMPPGVLPAGFAEKIMHATFRVGGSTLNASDGIDPGLKFAGFSLALAVPTEAEADRAFAALAAGGKVDMPLAKTFWSPRFGMLTDRFGLGWMVSVQAKMP